MVDIDVETIKVYELHDGKYVLAARGHGCTHPSRFAEDFIVRIDFAEIW